MKRRTVLLAMLFSAILLLGACTTAPGSSPGATGGTTPAPGGGGQPQQQQPQQQPEQRQNPDLAGTTALVAGAGQTATVTVTDPAVVRQVVDAVSSPLTGQAVTPGSLWYVRFMAGERSLGQLWVRADAGARAPMAIRFDGDETWHTPTPEAVRALQPVLQQVPGMKAPEPQLPVVFGKVDPKVPADVRDAIASWANNYLLHYVSDQEAEDTRLTAFRLDEIQVSGNADDPIYLAVYSIQPLRPQGYWMAGTGQPGDNGWIVQKIKAFRAVHKDGKVELTSAMP